MSLGEIEMVNNSLIPTRLATALLLKRGEISIGEIRALPLGIIKETRQNPK